MSDRSVKEEFDECCQEYRERMVERQHESFWFGAIVGWAIGLATLRLIETLRITIKHVWGV